MVEAADRGVLDSKSEAISAFSIYVILEQGRQKRMANAISHALDASDTWDFIKPYTPMLFCGPNTPSMNSLIILLSPYIGWDDIYHSEGDVTRWAAAASAVPYTEQVGRDVVSALVQISRYDSLRPHIPLKIWMWLKKHSTLPPLPQRRPVRITSNTICYIRGLKDIELFKSLLLLAWLQWITISRDAHLEDLLREDFCGIGMWGHRKDLIEQLNHIVRFHPTISSDYTGPRNVLLEVETEAAKTLIRMLPKLSFSISILIHANWDANRISLHLHLCSAPPLPMTFPKLLCSRSWIW